jgi:hypothetical protein
MVILPLRRGDRGAIEEAHANCAPLTPRGCTARDRASSFRLDSSSANDDRAALFEEG